MKKKSEVTIALSIRIAGIKPVSRARFTFLWIEPSQRRDPDNIVAGGRKFILDTLVDCGILVDDRAKYVKGWTDDWDYDKGHPRIEVTITECEK